MLKDVAGQFLELIVHGRVDVFGEVDLLRVEHGTVDTAVGTGDAVWATQRAAL